MADGEARVVSSFYAALWGNYLDTGGAEGGGR